MFIFVVNVNLSTEIVIEEVIDGKTKLFYNKKSPETFLISSYQYTSLTPHDCQGSERKASEITYLNDFKAKILESVLYQYIYILGYVTSFLKSIILYIM